MSSHQLNPIPLYPFPPLSSPGRHTQEDFPSDEYSDFPPIREHKSNSDSFQTPKNRFRPHSSVVRVRKGSKQCSSPTQSEPPHPQSPQYFRQRNKGLGRKDIFNTIEVPMKYPKVRTKSFTEAILLTGWQNDSTEVPLLQKYPKSKVNTKFLWRRFYSPDNRMILNPLWSVDRNPVLLMTAVLWKSTAVSLPYTKRTWIGLGMRLPISRSVHEKWLAGWKRFLSDLNNCLELGYNLNKQPTSIMS